VNDALRSSAHLMALPKPARQRVASADAETLLIWAERILDAKSLDDVWGR